MNDLSFGATLLSMFATLVVAIAVEANSAPAPRHGATTAARPVATAQRLAAAAPTDCLTIARAPSAD
jgi:hypothetical protein